jgi:uncharacterized protein YjdB
MSYIPIGDKSVQEYITILSNDNEFNQLSQAQQIQLINFGQQECAILSKLNNLSFYKTVELETVSPSVLITSILVQPSMGYLTGIGTTQQFTVVIEPSNATNQVVTWESSDPGVATVDENGLATQIAPGEENMQITAYTTDGSGLYDSETLNISGA